MHISLGFQRIDVRNITIVPTNDVLISLKCSPPSLPPLRLSVLPQFVCRDKGHVLRNFVGSFRQYRILWSHSTSWRKRTKPMDMTKMLKGTNRAHVGCPKYQRKKSAFFISTENHWAEEFISQRYQHIYGGTCKLYYRSNTTSTGSIVLLNDLCFCSEWLALCKRAISTLIGGNNRAAREIWQ